MGHILFSLVILVMTNFNDFWQIWPVKKNKAKAQQAWKKLKPTEEMLDQIKEDIRCRFHYQEWSLAEKQYIPHASTYLNQRRFEDEEYVDKRPRQIVQDCGKPKLTSEQDFIQLHTSTTWSEGL